jgi:hypothetical protein
VQAGARIPGGDTGSLRTGLKVLNADQHGRQDAMERDVFRLSTSVGVSMILSIGWGCTDGHFVEENAVGQSALVSGSLRGGFRMIPRVGRIFSIL